MIREHLVQTGEILKAHGVAGELLVKFDTPADVGAVTFLFPVIDGLPVPFRIIDKVAAGEDIWYISLGGIDSREKARSLTGSPVYLEKKYVLQHDQPESFVAGYFFRDKTSGKTGKIVNLIDIPENPLLEVECENGLFYLPAHTDFILKTDHKTREIILRLPEGLFERE